MHHSLNNSDVSSTYVPLYSIIVYFNGTFLIPGSHSYTDGASEYVEITSWLPSVFSETPLNCPVHHTILYIINRIAAILKVRWSIPLPCVALLPRHDTTLKLLLRSGSSRVWKILKLINGWELENRDELPLVMASGQWSASSSTAQPWAIKLDSQEHLKSAPNQSSPWSGNVIFSLSPAKFPNVAFPRATREGPCCNATNHFFKSTKRLKQPQILDSGGEILEINGVYRCRAVISSRWSCDYLCSSAGITSTGKVSDGAVMKHFSAASLHICHWFYPKRSATFLCCVDLVLPSIIKPAEEDNKTKCTLLQTSLWNQWAVNIEERECVGKRICPFFVSCRTIEIVLLYQMNCWSTLVSWGIQITRVQNHNFECSHMFSSLTDATTSSGL